MQQPSDLSFERLLDMARAGDEKAIGVLLKRYYRYLSVLARVRIDRNLQAKFDQSDVVQETMIQANRDFHRFRGTTEAALTRWLRAILCSRKAVLTRHYFGNRHRDPKFERRLQYELNSSSRQVDRALVASDASPSEKVVQREYAVLLADALSALPDHYRQVVIQHHVEGRTLGEVAKIMGRSNTSVKKLWARAMVELRQLMKGYQ